MNFFLLFMIFDKVLHIAVIRGPYISHPYVAIVLIHNHGYILAIKHV